MTGYPYLSPTINWRLRQARWTQSFRTPSKRSTKMRTNQPEAVELEGSSTGEPSEGNWADTPTATAIIPEQ